MAQVVIMMGSKSDEEKVSPCVDVLRSLGISYLFTVSSAHRTPERTEKILREQEAAGAKVFICAAGMAAHLAGAVAARTTRPVIGIPVSGGLMGGMDAMLATVQMPPGFPVATVAMDKAGARNAAWLAAQILAVADPALDEKIRAARAKMQAGVEEAAAEIEASTAASRPVHQQTKSPPFAEGFLLGSGLAASYILKQKIPETGSCPLPTPVRHADRPGPCPDGGSSGQ